MMLTHSNRWRAGGPPSNSSGFSMLEVMVALVVLLIGLSGFLRSLVGSMDLARSGDDLGFASRAVRDVLESMAAEDFEDVFALYNDVPGDDPDGAGTAPGANFAVPGLASLAGDPDGMVGRISFPTAPADDGVLCEVVNADDFPDMPRDLNLDGDALDLDVTADVLVLPVLIELEWRGARGVPQRFEVATLLSEVD